MARGSSAGWAHRLVSAGGLARMVAVGMIAAYRILVSPLFPASCRFYPTCSAYAQEAIWRHGVWRGGCLALRRILRCHRWNAGGYDPVPPVLDG